MPAITATFYDYKAPKPWKKLPSFEIYFSEGVRIQNGIPSVVGKPILFVIQDRRYIGTFGIHNKKVFTHAELTPVEPDSEYHTFGTILHGKHELPSNTKLQLHFDQIPETSGATLQVEVIFPDAIQTQTELPPITIETELVPANTGAGFGDPETNPIVEKAAMDFVTAKYRADGWTVEDISDEDRGYDLFCTRKGETRHVEVKGVSGDREELIITKGEVEKGKIDPDFFLSIVTNAQSISPVYQEYTGLKMLERFDFTPISFRAKPKK